METIKTEYGDYLVSRANEPRVYSNLMEHGAQQRGDLELVMALLPKGGIVYDIGAHIGTFAIPLAQHVGEQGHVFAFEGSPDTFDVLRQNIDANGLTDRVTPSMGIIAGPGETRFAQKRKGERRETTQFVSNESGDMASRTLDAIVATASSPDFIKIDVEGMEYEVITGGVDMISECRPMILFEANGSPQSVKGLVGLLRSHGYEIFTNVGDRHGRRPRWRVGAVKCYCNYRRYQDLLAVPCERRAEIPNPRAEWGWANIRELVQDYGARLLRKLRLRR